MRYITAHSGVNICSMLLPAGGGLGVVLFAGNFHGVFC
jgi:hypothetical protein